jgi:peroxiredoxin (alkyl hydroperoxide reductase subunit C)
MSETPNHLPLIGESAPSFQADTTQGRINFPADYKGKWVIFFSHPADLNCELLGLSIDSTFSHIAWLRTIREKVEFRNHHDVEVTFPVISDLTMDVARAYGMLQPSASTTQAVRAVFLIDPESKVRAILYYPLSNGRNFQEIKRLLTAIQTSDKYGVATPADWKPGEEVIVPPPGSCGAAKERVESRDPSMRCVDWFLCFKKLADGPEGETTKPEQTEEVASVGH